MSVVVRWLQAKSKREFVGQTEMTKTDRLRARRLKKKKQHEKRLKREQKEKTKKLKLEKSGGGGVKVLPNDKTPKNKMKLGATLNEVSIIATLMKAMASGNVRSKLNVANTELSSLHSVACTPLSYFDA